MDYSTLNTKLEYNTQQCFVNSGGSLVANGAGSREGLDESATEATRLLQGKGSPGDDTGRALAISPEVDGQYTFAPGVDEGGSYGLVGSSIIATQFKNKAKIKALDALYQGAPEGDNWIKVGKPDAFTYSLRKIKGRNKRAAVIGLGCVAFPEDVASLFSASVDNYTNSKLIYECLEAHDDYSQGQKVAFPMRSRWNFRDRSWYASRFWSIKRAIKPHKEVVLVSLTYSPAILDACQEADNYRGDKYGYALLRVWGDIKRFKDRLYRYKERELVAKHLARYGVHIASCVARGEFSRRAARSMVVFERNRFKKQLQRRFWWSHLATVIEPHESGIVHAHLVFKGNWVAPIDKLVQFWGLSEPQGVDVKSSNNYEGRFRPERYVSSYFKKALKAVKGEYVNLFYVYAYYYSVRFYNVAHMPKREPKAPKWLCIGSARTGADEWDGQTFSLFGRYRGIESIKNSLWWIDGDIRGSPDDKSMSQLNGVAGYALASDEDALWGGG